MLYMSVVILIHYKSYKYYLFVRYHLIDTFNRYISDIIVKNLSLRSSCTNRRLNKNSAM